MEVQAELIRLHEAACQRFPDPPAENINMVICCGELIGIVAPDDSMKHMLLELLTGSLQPMSGQRLVYAEKKGEFFGYIVSTQNLFADMSVTDNLLWMSNTSRKIIWSDKKDKQRAQEILRKYRLELDVSQRISGLSLAERYMLEIVKAIEILQVSLLVIDNIHLIGQEKERQRILELTKEFRRTGGAVVISSILRLDILQDAARIYLLREGRPIRTLFGRDHNIYRSHTDLFFSDYMRVTADALSVEKQSGRQESAYTLCLHAWKEEIRLKLQGTLGLYVSQTFSDRDVEKMLETEGWSLRHLNKPVPVKALSDLVRHNIGYFPKHVEDVMFYRLNLQDNVEIFAYHKLCRFPGILNSRLEKYFMNHCIVADRQTRKATNLSYAKHNVVLQTAINRYQQRFWDLMLIHAPVYIYDTLEYHLMQNFITDLLNQGTAVVLISNDRRLLSRFSYAVIDLSEA